MALHQAVPMEKSSFANDCYSQMRNMIFPKCAFHERACFMKTGTRDGATKGRSFFICSQEKDQCSFATMAKNVSPTYCSLHQEMNELQTVVNRRGDTGEKQRWYFRCSAGKKLGKGWCGHHDLNTDKPMKENALRDITRQVTVKDYIEGKDERKFKFITEKRDKSKPGIKLTENEGSSIQFDDVVSRKALPEKGNLGQSVDTINHSKTSSTCVATERSSGYSVPDEKVSYDETEYCRPKTSEQIDASPSSSQSNSCEVSNPSSDVPTADPFLRKINLSKLPDGGEKLRAHIQHLHFKKDDNPTRKHEEKPITVNNPSKTGSRKIEVIDIDALPLESNAADSRLGLQYHSNSTINIRVQKCITRETIEGLHRSLESRPTADEETPDPDGLRVTLLTHQRQALTWMQWREAQKPAGGILADDMGLGKTLTVISLVLSDQQTRKSNDTKHLATKNHSSSLIVCPAALLHQWKQEIEKRVKPLRMTVMVYHGQDREKRIPTLMRYNIVLTTYNIVSMEWKRHSEKPSPGCQEWLSKDTGSTYKHSSAGTIFDLEWHRVILDEAHHIKNYKCAVSKAVCDLTAEIRWAVTGTPIQNEIGDFYSLVKFLHCCPFDDLKVWRKDVDNKTKNGKVRLDTLVKCLLLRRTKDQFLSNGKPLVSLPSRKDITHSLCLSDNEDAVYNLLYRFSRKMLQIFLANGSNPTTVRSSTVVHTFKPDELILGYSAEQLLERFSLRTNASSSSSILLMVLRLRQCCSHMALMCDNVDSETCKDDGIDTDVIKEFKRLSISTSNREVEDSATILGKEFTTSFVSSKVSRLIEVTKEIFSENAVRCVIVSQWTKMLSIVQQHFQQNRFKTACIDGSVSLKRRSEIVDQFNSQNGAIEILFVSLRAGGVGLNLIGGTHLFLLDQHWNPALEDQACDRIYRVGQTRDVCIHRFLCKGTVEEKIATLQQRKKSLAASVIESGGAIARKLTFNDLRMMFGV